MNSIHHRIFLLLFSFSVFLSCKKQIDETKEYVLFDFEQENQLKVEGVVDASYKVIESGTTKLLQVKTGHQVSKPTIVLKQPDNVNWDLKGYHQVKADVANIGDSYMQVEMFVGDDPDGLIKWYCSDYVDLNPGEKKAITVDLAWTPWVFSPQLKVEGMRGIPGSLKTDIDAIKEISFCSRYASSNNTFTIDNIRAEGKLEVRDTSGFFPFVDKFGQYKHNDWKGKIHAEEELKQVAEVNLEKLLEKSGPEERGTYGGWTGGPKLEATGFFRTEKYKGKWWLVDPEGYLFWTAGVNCVSPNSAHTGTSGREHYFETLPKAEGEYAKFYGEGGRASHGFYSKIDSYTSFNFYQSNLFKKFDYDWQYKFSDLAHLRFKSWGLNTIGFVSDIWTTRQQKTAYVGSIWIRNTPKIQGSEGFWGRFHDVFDPKFEKAVKASMASQKEGAYDAWCIGYFVDNELSWGDLGSLSIGVLRSPETQIAKHVFVQDLTDKYTTIQALNQSWGTSHQSWEALLKSTETPDMNKAMPDLVDFYRKIAETYFKTIKEELQIIAPKQNYLGCRFAWANNDVVLTAASKYMDIMSFNKYEYSVENIGLPKGVDKPILIGEFHFGAVDRGMFHAGVKKAESQEDRGEKYQSYIQGALRNPSVIGAHWFQYIDEPLTGRFDGENYNIGLVDVCDNPYEALVEKIRETTYGMYSYRMSH
ncbi:beta-galactosidase [Tamlana fucoidanivorans]|uniref:Beta-agarase n=1 Tax=Allotamlana fucoidanivorans TaxID=2583814 RepID=A0A5C4SR01_9FLAO|nr:beta-galactosidase [Tamlana fucoidanivorans]TNJ46215.1 beta-agarase [Tamlana fucoidanivorans]